MIILGGHRIGAKGTLAISEALRRNIKLLCLGLGRTRFGIALAGALQQNIALESQGLDGKRVCFLGARALANALGFILTLKELFDCANFSGAEGCVELGKAIRVNLSLHSLSLRGRCHCNFRCIGGEFRASGAQCRRE